jgi:DNA-binding beta-propeller fold protein YncE
MKGDAIFSRHARAMTSAFLALFAATTTFSTATTMPVGGSDTNALLPTGQYLTATAAPGALYQRLSTGLRADGNADADSAMSSALSPDGKTLLVLTSGFNTSFNYQTSPYAPIDFPTYNPLTGGTSGSYNQAEFVFVYDVSTGTPIKIQQIPIINTFIGLKWDPSGTRFYVSGGGDDRILVFAASGSPVQYVPSAPFIILNHDANGQAPVPTYNGGVLANTPAGNAVPALVTGAVVAGFDVSRDGQTLVPANWHNESISIVNLATRTVNNDIVFTPPGSMNAVGEFPYDVAVKSNPQTGAFFKAYVTSERDSQVVVTSGSAITTLIPVPSGPSKMVLDSAQRYLYVACSNDDSIAVIDTNVDRVVRTISLARPGDVFKGSNPNSVAIGASGTKLYVTLGGENAVAVVSLTNFTLLGRIPVGWLPTSVNVSGDGKHLYVVNEKSTAGPNPGNVYYSWNTPYGISTNPTLQNQYTWALEKSGLLSIRNPTSAQLVALSAQVDQNNGFANRHADPLMNFLSKQIKHVIYIVNENRTFDQVYGDLGNGSNGQPLLTYFPQPVTPNLHATEAGFTTFDNFYDSSETSGVGWNWDMQGHTNDFVEKTQPVDYGNGNLFGPAYTYDWQGIVNHINLGLPATGGSTIQTTRITGILDPTGSSTILPGIVDPSATEGANNLSPSTLGGYIWEEVLRKGGTIRNYGWNCDLTFYGSGTVFDPPLVRNPYSTGTLQSAPSTPSIQAGTDEYYRAFDERYPDIFRIEEWEREYANFVATKTMPTLEVMTIPHDHTGSFGSAIEGLTNPTVQLADHDYAIGELIQTVTSSPYWASTAIVIFEDDPQDGQDHVEAHRSIINIISPYSKRGAIDHTTYFTTSALRTIEELLGLPPLGQDDANALPMSDSFQRTPNLAPYVATVPGVLCQPPVAPDLVPACNSNKVRKTKPVRSLHDGAWWTKHTVGLNFNEPDHVNPQFYNALLEYGMTGRGTLPELTPRAAASENYDADGDGK